MSGPPRRRSGRHAPLGQAALIFSRLTSRESEILKLLTDGLNNRQIARRLFLAEKTVRNYVSRIFTKLEVHDRAAAALRARDAGFGEQADTALPQPA